MPIPPFTPPDRRPPRKPGQPLPGGNALRAVLTGVAIDLCGSRLLGHLLVAIYAMRVITPGMTPAQVADALQNLTPSLGLILVGTVLGSLVSVAAGYACARIAWRHEYRVGALMAGAAVLLSAGLGDLDGAPDDLALLYVLCDVACVLLGVKYGARRNRRLQAPARTPADPSAP